MAFSLAHTQSVDSTSDTTRWADCRTALFYLFDTFLPARGWTTNTSAGTSGSVKRGLGWPLTDWRNSDTLTNHYSWTSISTAYQTSLTVYEDATYTTTPGDLMTDTTNSYSWLVNDATTQNSSWKFWTSTEDTSLFMVTRANQLITWGGNFELGVWYPNSNYTVANTTDTYRTQYAFPSPGLYYTNQPFGTNTASNEFTARIGKPTSYSEPLDLTFQKNFYIESSSTSLGRINYSDIRQQIPPSSARSTGFVLENLILSSTLYKYQNGSDWYLSTGVPSNSGLAFSCGTTEPDLS